MRGLPNTFWYLWTGALVNRLGGFVFTFLALYLTGERGYSIEEAGLVVALYGAGSVASGPVGGVLADRWGRRGTMMTSMLLGAAAMVDLGFARNGWHIGVSTLVLGFLIDLYRPALQAAIADVVPPADRTRAYGYLYWAINLGFAGAAIIAGLVAHTSFSVLFLVDAASTVTFATIIFLRVPETRPASAAMATHSPLQGLAAPFRDRLFIAFMALQLFVCLIGNQGVVALPLDIRAHGLSTRTYGLLIALNGVLIVLFQPLALGPLQKWGRGRALALGAFLYGIGFGLTGLSSHALTYALSIAVWTAGEIFSTAVAPAVVADAAPTALRGSYQGTFYLSWSAASFMAPALGSLVMGRLGAGTLWAGCAVVGTVAALLHLPVVPRIRRAPEATTHQRVA